MKDEKLFKDNIFNKSIDEVGIGAVSFLLKSKVLTI